MFRRLLAISGVGPKTASTMLSLGPIREIEQHIERADAGWLCRVPGIGKKTAQKIILELKGKLAADTGESGEEVLSALVSMGFAREAAREALMKVVDTETTVEGRLRAAMRLLGRKP
jgi:Holliday junction DNA helicase RuvA